MVNPATAESMTSPQLGFDGNVFLVREDGMPW